MRRPGKEARRCVSAPYESISAIRAFASDAVPEKVRIAVPAVRRHRHPRKVENTARDLLEIFSREIVKLCIDLRFKLCSSFLVTHFELLAGLAV